QAGGIALPHIYAQVDYDALDTGGGRGARWDLPGQNNYVSEICFPNFPGSAYNNGQPTTELVNHPLRYNVYQPHGGHRLFAPSSTEALLRIRERGARVSGFYTANGTFQTAYGNRPNTTFDQGQPYARRVTALSTDLDRPGVTPWYYNLTPDPMKMITNL